MAIARGAIPRLPAAEGAALDRALARADAYRVLAELLRDPDDPADDAAPDPGTLRGAVRSLGVACAPGTWRAIARIADREHRAVEHRAIFGHTVAHGCPPYETEFGRRHLFGQSQELADIRGFYEAFGVRPRRGGERPDHLACELEFLSLLAIKEATSLALGEDDRVSICRDAARRFVEDHPGRWVAATAARIAARAPGSGHAATAAVATAVLGHHSRELGAAPRIVAADDLLPVTEEPDGFAFECGADAEAGDLVPPGADR
jgi:TorA maturation chaperone TorD